MMVLEMWLLMTPASTLRHINRLLHVPLKTTKFKTESVDYKLKVNASYQVSEEWYVDCTSVRGMLIGQLTQQHREAQPLREPFLLYQEHGDRQLPVDGFRDSR